MFQKASLGVKLIGSFMIVAVITLGVGYIGWHGATGLSGHLHEVGKVRLPSIESLLQIESGFKSLRVAQRTLLNPDLPAEARALPEALPSEAELPDGSRHGENSWPRLGYGGPCPPSGTHRYFFKLYALDTVLALEAGADVGELSEALEGHVLGYGELMGTYAR